MKKKLALVLGILLVLGATNALAWGGLWDSVDEPPSNPKPLNPPVKSKSYCGDNC
jgi:hypothetical protein